ncbi:MSMEG_4193 family putative phosphomutase [Nocardioides sp. R-C-SC26]|uniref:MSMEG_4193 family putative phosphomutase n=1 Tax=Nocardioides sp. R-C-SC26 TaxID=2870414 RepID=UPI001E3C2D7B|nr:MSMEG_4193 family putative phosphomutase [Nocardioides sp. R-C-SC26]
MATVILVRHGRTTANASGVLAGRLAGVRLDDVGEGQASRAAARIAAVPIAALVSSPQERCQQTAQYVAKASPTSLSIATEDGIAECDYGEWQGRPLKDLAQEPLWKVVQTQPSAASFPGGEAMSTMYSRAVAAIRGLDAQIAADHGKDAVWVAVSHGDIIKAVLADALGMHLDLFQRLHVDPASISIVRYTATRPYVMVSNSHAGDLDWLAPKPADPEAAGEPSGADADSTADDAVVGGGAGPRSGQ